MEKTLSTINDITHFQGISDKLICPVCRHKISFNDHFIKCFVCGNEFPVINSIPILINEDDSIFNIKDYTAPIVTQKQRIKRNIKYLLSLLPSLSNNLSSKRNFQLLQKLLSDKVKPKILIIGGAQITTDTEMIINSNNIVIESDIYIGERTQIILDSHHIPFENETFDLIIFQAVLEHVADPYKCIQEAHRVLNSDGLIFAATPFMQQVHMKAFDFTRFTHLGHRRLFREFEEIESGVFAGTGVALGWSIRAFTNSFFNNKYINKIFQLIVSFLFFWLKYFDYIIRNKRGTYDGASGFYFIGRKSNKILSDKELIKLFRGL